MATDTQPPRYGPPGVHSIFAASPAEARAAYPDAAIIRWFTPGSYFVFGTPADAVAHFTTVRAAS